MKIKIKMMIKIKEKKKIMRESYFKTLINNFSDSKLAQINSVKDKCWN